MKKGISRLAVCLFWLGVWQAASLLVAQELFIPSPRRVGERLFALAGSAVFWKAIGATLLRIAAGYAGGMCLGSLFGLLTWRIPALHRLFAPLLALLRAAPVSSFILLVLLWVPAGLVPVCISTLLVAGLFWQTVYDGAHSMDKLFLEMAQVYRLSPRVRFRAILWPSIRPVFLSTASTAIGLAWKSGVAAEVLSHPAFSMGKALYESKIYLETPDLFAWTLLVVVFSMLFEHCFRRLFARAAAQTR